MRHNLDRYTEDQAAGKGKVGFFLSTAAAAMLFILILGGCDNTLGVFSSIAGEKKQTGVDLFNNTIVHAMAEDGSHYYALLGKVAYRPKDGSAGWEILAVGGSTNYFSPGIASDGTTLYVAKANAGNILEDIYKSTNAGSAGAAWTGLNAAAALSAHTVQWLRCVNGWLFVAVKKESDNSYSLFYFDGANFVSAGPALASLSSPLLDVAWDGSEYWAISTSKVFHGAAGNLAEESAPALADGILGIAADEDTGRVIISRSDGKLYDNGSGSWSSVEVKAGTALGPVFILKTPAATTQRLLFGKGVSAYGYMEMAYANPLDKNTLKENGTDYISTTKSVYLSTAAGKRLVGFWQSGTGELFMMLAAGGTSSYALYRNTFDPSANNGAGGWSGWTAE